MAQIPTPPASRHDSESPELKEHAVADSADVLQSLDILLEKYLLLLDRHQQLQAELAKHLSSGFLSLAHANYTCPPGRRYGADYYDERMKATRKLTLHPPQYIDQDNGSVETEGLPVERDQLGEFKHIFTIESTTNDQAKVPETNQDTEESQPSVDSTQEDNSSHRDNDNVTEQPVDSSELSETEPNANPKPKPSKKKFRSSDPIHWYGVLVPPSLRSAQKSFTEAVVGQLPELASVSVEMMAVEKEVGRLRSELGQI